MTTISVQDIQQDLLAFFGRVKAGESFLVTNGEQTLAEVRPVLGEPAELRPYGLCAGQFTVPADFDAPLPDHVFTDP